MAADIGDALGRPLGLPFLLIPSLIVAVACGPDPGAPVSQPSSGGGADGFYQVADGGAGEGGAFDWIGRTVPATQAQTMTVQVDADMTLTAAPGQGVGLFVEYRAGGHWNFTWSCDTLLSGQPCAYDVAIATLGPASGVLSHVSPLPLTAGDRVRQPSPQQVEASTLTQTSLDGVTLDAPPGSSIEINALLGGAKDGVSIFFVQNGKVNGGYSGALTDPLIVEPSSP